MVPDMGADAVYVAMKKACVLWSQEDERNPMFTSAGFSKAFMGEIPISGPLDGIMVAEVLRGRDDVYSVSKGHWRMRSPQQSLKAKILRTLPVITSLLVGMMLGLAFAHGVS